MTTTVQLRGSTYTFEALSGTRLGALIPLFRDAFAREFTPDRLERKYSCEHAGISAFACVAFSDGGDAAGVLGVLPWPVRFGDRVETAGQLADGATDPAHRDKGLFIALAERVRTLCADAGISFLFGFPNEKSYPVFMKKLGYEHSDDLVEHRWPVRTLPLEKASHRAGPLRRLYHRYSGRKLDALAAGERLQNSLVADGFAGVDRGADFHAYKQAIGDSRVIETAGGRAWIKIRHSLMIGDLEATSAEDLALTMRDLRRLATRLGVDQIVSQTSKDTRLSRFFATRPGASRELPVIHRDLGSSIPRERLRYTLGDLDNF